MYSEDPLDYQDGEEKENPLVDVDGATGFGYPPIGRDLEQFLSVAMGHHNLLHDAGTYADDDDDDDDDEEVEVSEESDDEQSNGDETSEGERDE